MQWPDILAYLKQHTEAWYGDSERESIARRLVEHISGRPFFSWKMNRDASLPDTELLPYVNELATGKPLQYVLGYEYFSGMKLTVNHHVLIPRPETEELVQWIVSLCGHDSHNVLDIGTGSGCIALALKKACPQFTVQALDCSKEALAVAQENARQQGLSVTFFIHDILQQQEPLNTSYSLWVSNPPYILAEEKMEMSPQVLNYEPHTALFVHNENPLQFYDAIAKQFLKQAPPKAYLFFELSSSAAHIIDYFQASNQFILQTKNDMYGHLRMLCLQKIETHASH